MKKWLCLVIVVFTSLSGLFAGIPKGWHEDVLFVFPETGREVWVQAIENAERKLQLAAYRLSDPIIIDALSHAKERGVDVEILLEPAAFSHDKSGSEITNVDELKARGFKVYTRPESFNQVHYKLLLADVNVPDKTPFGLIATLNLDAVSFDGLSGTTKDACRDFAAPIFDEDVLKEASQGFESDCKDMPFLPPQPSKLIWGPVDQRSILSRYILGAKKSLDIYQQDIQDEGIVRLIVQVIKQKNIKVRLIMMPYPFSKTKDNNTPNQKLIVDAGGEVWLQHTNYIHTKMMLVDGGKTLILTSANFYPPSLDQTRELGIILDNAQQIQTFIKTFEADLAISTRLGIH